MNMYNDMIEREQQPESASLLYPRVMRGIMELRSTRRRHPSISSNQKDIRQEEKMILFRLNTREMYQEQRDWDVRSQETEIDAHLCYPDSY